MGVPGNSFRSFSEDTLEYKTPLHFERVPKVFQTQKVQLSVHTLPQFHATMSFPKCFVVLCAFALFSAANSIFVPSRIAQLAANPLLNNATLAKVNELQQKILDFGGCGPNVCFALDGSGSVSEDDWDSQRFLVELVAAVVGVDTNAEFAAVQYGLRNILISLLTGNVDQFLLAVDRSRLRRARRTFISAGLAFCIRQLNQRPGDANKIVLLGDGRSNFGGNPIPTAERWLSAASSNRICSVGVGFENTSVLQAIAGGDPDMVLTSDDWEKVTNILGDLVYQVCGIPPGF